MSRLFIAEKPSLGRAIADVLGVGERTNTHIVCQNGDIVTWCFGHLLELAKPEAYGFAGWTRESLPMIPDFWKLEPRDRVKQQLSAIEKLMKKHSTVVHAGDPDREGQLLVDEVLDRANYAGRVQRLLLSALDEKSVRKALDSMKPNSEFKSLMESARARGRADWLVGMNGTRAMTLLGRKSGHIDFQEVLSVGRVQTPTLALVVERDRQIEEFQAKPYLVLRADFVHPSGSFKAAFVPEKDCDGLDEEGRLIDSKLAAAIVKKVSGKSARVMSVSKERKAKSVPLPHCLSSLQKAMSAKLGMTAQMTLNIAQTLYEKKLTTYPRSDCRYLPEEQFSQAASILTVLGQVSELSQAAINADSSLVGQVWDTSKVTAHHAIIPTGEPLPDDLTTVEKAVFNVIALAYCLQFHPACEYETQKIKAEVENSIWEAKGRVILKAGWTAYASESDEDKKEADDSQALPNVTEGEDLLCQQAELLEKKTSPPKRFTEGTLIEAMANIHRFLSPEEADAKAILKDAEGLGTEATRAGIIETLKQRGYIEAAKKTLISTSLGRMVISLAPQLLKDPLTTARWESRLTGIAEGKDSEREFLREQVELLPALMEAFDSAQIAPKFVCPECGEPILKRFSKKTNQWFWACHNKAAHNDKLKFFPEVNGQPLLEKKEFRCPECNGVLVRFQAKDKPGEFLWGCFNREAHADNKARYYKDSACEPVLKSNKNQKKK